MTTPSAAPVGRSAREEKTVCRMCHGGCGAIVTFDDDQPVGIRGDPANPVSEGFFCVKGKASLDLLRSPDRLTVPLRRVGARFEGRFEPVSWEEALDVVAGRLTEGMRAYGAESLALAQGTDRNYQEWVFRLANAVGTPNVVGPAHVCFYPRVMASILTYGGFTFCDYEGDPEVILLWGSNKLHTHSDGVIGIKLAKAMQRGARLITIDPVRTTLAARSERHLAIRPGTDAALALGMLNLIIREGWFDSQFVADHTSGFEQLADHVARYDLSTVTRITELPADDIWRTTRTYATAARACIEAGTGLSQNRNSFDTLRAVAMISALCGNLDAPGGDLIWEPMSVDGRRTFPLSEILPPGQAAKRLGGGEHRILSMAGWVAPAALQDALITDRPYHISSLVVFGSNLLTSHDNSRRGYEALSRLGFLVVCDMFMTPTARMADVILPVSSWLERDQIVEFNSYIAPRKKLAQVGECKSDEEIIIELATRLGVGRHFFPSLKDALDAKLRGLGLNWDRFKDVGPVLNEKRYRKYLHSGFRTRSGRVNLYHSGLEAMGYRPMPVYEPLPDRSDDLPYLLISAHSRTFYNSEYHQLPTAAKHQPAAEATIHPSVARREGVQSGALIRLFTRERPEGVSFRARISTDVPATVICADPCWWYPGEASLERSLRSSVNALTTNTDPDPHMGSTNLRGIPVGLRREELHEQPVQVPHG